MILSDFASVSRLLRRLVIPFAPLVILLVLLLVWDRLLFASGSPMEGGYTVRGNEMTTHGACFAVGNKNTLLRVAVKDSTEEASLTIEPR